MQHLIPVILCGGAGSRLWPVSRESFPKQLVDFGGGESLLQNTLKRVSAPHFGKPIVVTGQEYRFLAAEQIHALGIDCDIVLEPERRDSCAAIIAAAFIARQRDPEAVILALAADHAMPDIEAFQAQTLKGVDAARAGRIVAFGVTPAAPSAGYGYIRPGEALENMGEARAIEAFVEKPDIETAARYVEEGYLWNSGNFLFQADAFLNEAARLAPAIHDPVVEAAEHALRDLDFMRLNPQAFGRAEALSIDYAIMEKTDKAAVTPVDFPWSDVGVWGAVWDLAQKDANANAFEGDALFEEASGCYVHSPHMLTAVVGLKDVVVAATRDALLVTHRDEAQKVKDVVLQLAAKGRAEAIEHKRIYRPWGDYEQIDEGARFQVKRITVKPGGVLSLQSHLHRAEHWVVVRGTAKALVNDEVKMLRENESVYIPLGATHRLENPGRIPLELIEVQTGSYLGEDDIIRYEDLYNRA